MKNNWVPKKKTVVTTLIILGLSIVFYLASLFVMVQKQKEIENVFRSTESEVSKGEKRWVLKSILSVYTEEIQTLRNFLIRKGDEVTFIEQIEGVGRVSGIQFEIKSIDLKTKVESSFKEDVMIKMSINGKWDNIISFIDHLEKMPFGVLIENFDLKTSGAGEWSGSISMVVFREK